VWQTSQMPLPGVVALAKLPSARPPSGSSKRIATRAPAVVTSSVRTRKWLSLPCGSWHWAQGSAPWLDGAWVAGVLERLTSLAARAADTAEACPADLAPAAGSALAVPMCRGAEMYGVLAVARRRGQPPLDDAAIAAVSSLAVHAGTAVANVQEHLDAQRMSVTDPLTGAGNMRHLTSTLAREVERAHRFGRTLSVLMLDLDHFKQVNDTYGHQQGDRVLREVARVVRENSREIDDPARYGGEELAVALPQTDLDGAFQLAERMRHAIEGIEVPVIGNGGRLKVTASFGVAALPVSATDKGGLIAAADAALYAAKRAGKNTTVRAQ